MSHSAGWRSRTEKSSDRDSPEDFLAPGLRLAAELKFKMAAYDNITRNDKVGNLYSFFMM